MTTAWWSRRSSRAVATTGSPKSSPHSAKPRLEVRIMAPFFVAGIDELEEQIAASWDHGLVADFIDDKERGPAKVTHAFAKRPFLFGLGERGDDIGEGGEGDTASGLDRLDCQCGGQMALAGARWAEQVHHFGAINELQLS